MKKISFKKINLRLGLVSVIFYIICTLWGGLFQSLELKELHFQLLQLAYPGFEYNILGYIIGLIEAFIYGYLFWIVTIWFCKKNCITH